MTLLYLSRFQVGGTNTMGATVAGAAATITAATYMAGDLAATGQCVQGSGYTAFPAAVKAAFDAATSDTFTVSISSAGLYTANRATNFTLSFTTDAEVRLRNALGFTGNKTGANTYTSDEVPKYVMAAAIDARSAVSNVYEPAGIVEEAVSDGRDPYGTELRTDELLSDWTQTMESKAAVFTRSATRANAWSWQAFFAHHRLTHPFGVRGTGDDDDGDPIYYLTADGASFRPERLAADDDTYFNVPFKCRDRGEANP